MAFFQALHYYSKPILLTIIFKIGSKLPLSPLFGFFPFSVLLHFCFICCSSSHFFLVLLLQLFHLLFMLIFPGLNLFHTLFSFPEELKFRTVFLSMLTCNKIEKKTTGSASNQSQSQFLCLWKDKIKQSFFCYC